MGVKVGDVCPTCGQRKDGIDPETHKSIVHGHAIGLTEAGRRFILKNMIAEWQRDVITMAGYIIARPDLTADDDVYTAAKRILKVAVDDFPDRHR